MSADKAMGPRRKVCKRCKDVHVFLSAAEREANPGRRVSCEICCKPVRADEIVSHIARHKRAWKCKGCNGEFIDEDNHNASFCFDKATGRAVQCRHCNGWFPRGRANHDWFACKASQSRPELIICWHCKQAFPYGEHDWNDCPSRGKVFRK